MKLKIDLRKRMRTVVKPILTVGEKIFRVITRFCNLFWTAWDILVYRPKVTFEDRNAKALYKKGGVILASNHIDHKDGSFMPHVLGMGRTRVIVTRKWYDKPLIRPFFEALDYIPIDLRDTDTEWEAIAKKALYDGQNVLIFPEGELERSDVMLPFMPGFLMLARHTQAPVLPVAISGDYTPGQRMKVRIGGPLGFDPKAKGRPSVILREGAALYRKKVMDMLWEMADMNSR